MDSKGRKDTTETMSEANVGKMNGRNREESVLRWEKQKSVKYEVFYIMCLCLSSPSNQISSSGLVVKFIVAIDEPWVRFPAGATAFVFPLRDDNEKGPSFGSCRGFQTFKLLSEFQPFLY